MLFQPSSPQTSPSLNSVSVSLRCPSSGKSDDRPGNLDAWKPPHEWECASPREESPPVIGEEEGASQVEGTGDHYMSPNIVAVQREVRMMAEASPELMLANMKANIGDASDATVYKELEMTRKRWMFSALHRNEGYANLDRACTFPESPCSSRPPRILAIYETQGKLTFIIESMHSERDGLF